MGRGSSDPDYVRKPQPHAFAPTQWLNPDGHLAVGGRMPSKRGAWRGCPVWYRRA